MNFESPDAQGSKDNQKVQYTASKPPLNIHTKVKFEMGDKEKQQIHQKLQEIQK